MTGKRRPKQPGYGVYRDKDDPQVCRACGYVTDSASEFAGNRRRMPKEGDASICLNCANVSIFTGDGLQRRPATPLETAEVQAQESEAFRRLRARGPLPTVEPGAV